MRIYQTPAGLRLLATHRPFDPAEPAVRDFFQAVGVDPLYARMCFNQQCFRARLTAKPWHIGISTHPQPRPGVWPVAPEDLPRRTAWVAAYEHQAAQFAACSFVASTGSGAVHERLQAVIDLHDSACRCHAVDAVIA